MGLNIVVCIKQVSNPDYFSEITLDPDTGSIQRDKIPAILNPLDENAIEEALRIREKYSGKVTVVSMGPPKAKEVIDWALCLGADEGVLLSDRAFAGGDSLATAYALARYIQKIGLPDIILCGNQTADGATGQVAPQLAEILNIPHVTYVSEVNLLDEKTMVVKRNIEYGGYLKVEAKLPVLLAVSSDINEVRTATAEGIMCLMDKEYKELKATDIGAEKEFVGLDGSPTRVIGTFQQKIERRREILEGSGKNVVANIIEKLQQLEVL